MSDKNNVISRRCEKEDFCLKKQSELMHVHYKPGRVTTKAKSLVSTYTVSENNVHHFIAGWMQPCLYVDTDLLYIWTMTQLLCETVTFSYTLHVGSTSSLYRFLCYLCILTSLGIGRNSHCVEKPNPILRAENSKNSVADYQHKNY